MGFFKVEVAAVNRASANHAFDAFVFYFAEFLDIGHIGQTTRGDHRYRECLREFDGSVDVDATQHAITANIGVDDGFDSVVFEFFAQVDHFVASQFAPTVGSHFAVFGV